MSYDVGEALALVVATLRETARQVDEGSELPHLAINPSGRGGYATACRDIADSVERGTIAGGVLRPYLPGREAR